MQCIYGIYPWSEVSEYIIFCVVNNINFKRPHCCDRIHYEFLPFSNIKSNTDKSHRECGKPNPSPYIISARIRSILQWDTVAIKASTRTRSFLENLRQYDVMAHSLLEIVQYNTSAWSMITYWREFTLVYIKFTTVNVGCVTWCTKPIMCGPKTPRYVVTTYVFENYRLKQMHKTFDIIQLTYVLRPEKK